MLICARIVQSAGAALMISQVLTGIQLNFHGYARTRALGAYSAVLAGSAVAGQVLGGVIVQANLFGASWRPIFLINVPLGILLVVCSGRYLPAGRPGGGPGLDVPGVAALTVALSLVVAPLIVGRPTGWPPWVMVALAGSLPALAAFVVIERRQKAQGAHPVVDLGLLARPPIAWGLATAVLGTATYYALLFVLLALGGLSWGFTFAAMIKHLVGAAPRPRVTVHGFGIFTLVIAVTTLTAAAALSIRQRPEPNMLPSRKPRTARARRSR